MWAVWERQQRIEQSLVELEQIWVGKNKSEERAQARASLTDPEARIMKQAQGAIGPAYNVQLSTDATERIIVGVGVSQAATDAAELEPAVERIEANLEQKPQQMVVDGGFTHQGTVEAMEQRQIELIGSLTDRRALTEATLRKRGVAAEFFPSAFAYDPEQNHYTCPAGKVLRYEGREKQNGNTRHRYRAVTADCQACPWRRQCCPDSRKGRSLVRVDLWDGVGEKSELLAQAVGPAYCRQLGGQELPLAEVKLPEDGESRAGIGLLQLFGETEQPAQFPLAVEERPANVLRQIKMADHLLHGNFEKDVDQGEGAGHEGTLVIITSPVLCKTPLGK